MGQLQHSSAYIVHRPQHDRIEIIQRLLPLALCALAGGISRLLNSLPSGDSLSYVENMEDPDPVLHCLCHWRTMYVRISPLHLDLCTNLSQSRL